MDYPEDFPEHFKLPIERAIADAEIEYLTWNSPGSRKPIHTNDQLMYAYVKKVFFTFAKQAREAARQGIWSLERVRNEMEAYLHELIADVYTEKSSPTAVGFSSEFFGTDTTRGIRISKEWIRHQKDMAALAKAASSEGQAKKIKEFQSTDRKSLRDFYLVAFPGEKILDICWAAGQHYSEWKRWIRNAVKDGSAPDRAFRAMLTSSKLPAQYRRQPRPSGWK